MQQPIDSNDTRRGFLMRGGVLIAATAVAGSGRVALAQDDDEHEHEEEEEVSPGEDLMREHGVLKRILLIYDESERRLLAGGADLSPDAIHQSASLIRSFIEDYHEKLEENFLFPRFRKANTLVELVDVLAAQHAAGRRLTELTLQLATNDGIKDAANRKQLANYLHQFVRMYAPHEAREDTVLFPALRKIVSENEYDSLGEDFENEEHRRFGEGGFEEMVDRVAVIEKQLGIYDLAQFTPKV